MQTKLEREEFFDLCWEKSISWFCENYQVSYQEFKVICDKFQIPLPPNGYWTKRKFGKKVNKPKLPESNGVGKIELDLRTKENTKKSNASIKLQSIGDEDKAYNLDVPKRLPKNPDPIILEMLADYPKKHPVNNNIWDYTKRYNYGRIWLNATGESRKRALCFLDTFIKMMKARGHYFIFCYERSYIVIEGIEIGIRVRERYKRVYETEESGYRSSKLVSIGFLSIITGEYSGKKEWQETPNKSLAEKLPHIINYLEEEAKNGRKWKVENEKRKKEQAIEKKKQEERERLRKEEIEKLRLIKQKSDLWHETNKLRAFLRECDHNENLTQEMKDLVSFGYQKVDWMDPFTSTKDELFSDLDPYKVFEALN